ncbi:hypothetical protein [Halorientalis halophila]|uniref:hypothetical protein n=1 Tax=Halorientalis halophila TaxID=3108499 RepID=UPI00300A966B
MCHGLAPAFVLRDEIAEELLTEVERAAASGDADADGDAASTGGTPAFATEDEPAGEALTGGASDRSDRPSGGPQ